MLSLKKLFLNIEFIKLYLKHYLFIYSFIHLFIYLFIYLFTFDKHKERKATKKVR